MADENNKIRRLVLISLLLALLVVSLGAYTRLTNAGLGCPDWPGCYGLIFVPETQQQIIQAEKAFPGSAVEPAKAWNEMIHRYFAGGLGLCIFIIALWSFKRREQEAPYYLPLLILAMVIFQGILGMYTVTLKLMPVVVMGHLLGGFATLSLLFLLYLRLSFYHVPAKGIVIKKYGRYGLIGIVLLTGQIALGGWTSSNYAALACTELPICQAGWLDMLTFEQSFDLIPPEMQSYEYGHLDHMSRVTIHVMHRLGAVVIGVYLLWLAVMVYRKVNSRFIKNAATGLAFMVVCQITIGAANVWFSLPLALAVSHNVVAACLMLSLITLTYRLRRENSKEMS